MKNLIHSSLAAGCAMMALSVPLTASAEEIDSIGMMIGDLGNPFYVAQRRSAEAEAAGIGPDVTVTTVAHNFDLKKANDLVENFIASGTDLLLLESAGDNASLESVIAKAHAAGITVIGMHSPVEGADASVMTDNVKAGQQACQLIADRLEGKGNVVIVNGPTIPSVTDRVDGCHEVLDTYPDITVLSDNQDAKGTREGGMQVMQSLLVANPQIDAVFTINDPSAAGAELAIRQARRQNQMFIVSVDGAPDAVVALKDPDSIIIASAPQDPYAITEKSVELGRMIRNGEDIGDPIVQIGVPLATKENVDSYEGWDR